MRNRDVHQHFEMIETRFGGASRAEVVALLHVENLMDRMPDTLSGGEQRRVEVALALVRNPLCLLADEPYMGVEPKDSDLLGAAFRALASRGCAVVITGHEARTLMDLADSVCWMTSGTTHSLGAPALARKHFQFQREYLGV